MQSLLSHLNLNIQRVTPVHGGDINKSYCIEADKGKFCLKVNNTGYPSLFEREANGLKALAATNTLQIADVIDQGTDAHLQYLLLRWFESGHANSNTWIDFGRQLAQMHQQPQPAFGFTEDNYLGTYLQQNPHTATWPEFYSEFRLLPLIKLLNEQHKITNATVQSAERFCKILTEIYPGEPPSMLHGDLWSGNFIITPQGKVVLIDPAVYCGHREMDIAMTKLFGGFNILFYDTYQEVYPLEKGWVQRLQYSQLYPLLFHAYAFGGSYTEQVKSILKEF